VLVRDDDDVDITPSSSMDTHDEIDDNDDNGNGMVIMQYIACTITSHPTQLQ
jgi:hypothetical protein